MSTFSNSYIITARNQPNATSYDNIVPLPNGGLWYYSASGQYNPEVSDYSANGPAGPSPSSGFLGLLAADLKNATQLTVVIHGLGNLFSDSIAQMARLGSGLQQYASYSGLVISFDWPSYDMFDSGLDYGLLPYSFPPSGTSGTVRGNINGTVPAFGNFITLLKQLRLQYKIPINFICHSEGNYMMMLGMNAQTGGGVFLNQVLLAAADINNGALQSVQPNSPPYTGQGANISGMSEVTTIYYSNADDVLPWSQATFGKMHDPSYPGRLGLEGPSSFPGLASSVYGVDCSAVVLDANQPNIPQWPAGISSHSSYFYIPQVLQDWAQTLQGTAPSKVINRVPNGIASNGFVMQYVAAPALQLRRRRKAAA